MAVVLFTDFHRIRQPYTFFKFLIRNSLKPSKKWTNGSVLFNGHGLTRTPLQKGITSLQKNNQYIVNVGSVGQPRDGNNCAKYVVWDSTKNRIEIKYVAYDIAAVAAGIKARGMPQSHANRLW